MGVPSVEIRRHALSISFLDRICLQLNGNGKFWQKDVRKNINIPEKSALVGLTRGEWSFYPEYRLALKFLSRATGDLSDVQALSCKVLYKALV